MKKILLMIGLLLILGLAFSTQNEKTNKENVVEEVVEDELVLEDWMTKPFNI